jgi:site-specific recombinase XerD
MPRKLSPPVFRGLPLSALLPSFVTHLRDGHKSENTIKQYQWAVESFLKWCEANARTAASDTVTPGDVSAFQRNLLDTRAPATADAAHRALRVFFEWAVAGGEMVDNPIAKVARPKVQVKPVDIIPPEWAKRLFAACQGGDYDDVRDMAVIRLMWDSGGRRKEIGELKVDDVRFESNIAIVTGKGDKIRAIPFTPTTAKALRRYLTTARPRHPDAARPHLWLGANGPMTPDGIRHILDKRAEKAKLPHLRPHQFRNTLAHRFLAAGGNQNSLMLLMGWTTPQMVARYVASTATELAHSEYHRLGLDEI